MRFAIAAAFALIAAPSLAAQSTQAKSDLATATPISGSWSYAATTDGSEATFTNAMGIPQLWIRCARSTQQVTIAKPATAAAPYLSVWTSAQSRNVPASFNPANDRLTIALDGRDPLLDALSNSRGRIGFTVSPQPSLVVPAWAEVARVVEDCRA